MTIEVRANPIKRGELAKRSGCNLETIRYYENIGIMPPPMRSHSGHRLYAKDDQQRLRFILRCRELGFSIDDIRKLLSMANSQHNTCNQVYTLTKEYLASVTKKIEHLQNLERNLETVLQECSNDDTPNCPIITSLYQTG